MQTPWGELEVHDSHVHYFSETFFSLLTGGRPAAEVCAQTGWTPPVDLANQWISELDRHGVASASLIASLPGDEDSVIAAVDSHPSRFHGQFLLHPLTPGAVARAERAFAMGLSTVCLFPAMHRYGLEEAGDVIGAAAGRTVFVHCGALSVGVRKKLGLPSPFDMRYSNPIDLHAVALRHPDTRFVIPHFGAGYFREALMVADLCPNVYLDTSSSNGWMRYEGLTLEAVFRRALDVAGPDRLLFGTDSSFFPRGWVRPVFDAQCAAMHAIGVTAGDAAQILGGNLLRLISPA
ncbi:MAG: amidohydrolase [Acidobacteria bacterium]|nr:amidohydrolase [Acidobacteriota bacterium]